MLATVVVRTSTRVDSSAPENIITNHFHHLRLRCKNHTHKHSISSITWPVWDGKESSRLFPSLWSLSNPRIGLIVLRPLLPSVPLSLYDGRCRFLCLLHLFLSFSNTRLNTHTHTRARAKVRRQWDCWLRSTRDVWLSHFTSQLLLLLLLVLLSSACPVAILETFSAMEGGRGTIFRKRRDSFLILGTDIPSLSGCIYIYRVIIVYLLQLDTSYCWSAVHSSIYLYLSQAWVAVVLQFIFITH